MAAASPKVTVITPVYNGAAFIGEALASVRRQTWSNWDCVVLDNCSTDATAAIVEKHARRDARIRLHRNERHLPIIANWNAALRLLPDDAAYCKVLHADDWLEPQCLELMVAAAERYPTVGLVSAYVHNGIGICGTGLSTDRELFSGAEVACATMRREIYVFGSPSALLMRADLVRSRPAFYDERFYHADFEICYQLLRTHNLAFVHKVLTHNRLHPGSQTSTFAARFNTAITDQLGMLRKHGAHYLGPEEFERRFRREFRACRRLLARRLLAGRGKNFWLYHQAKLKAHGCPVGAWDLFIGGLEEMLNAPTTLPGILKRRATTQRAGAAEPA